MLLNDNFAVDTAIKLTIEKGNSILKYQKLQYAKACSGAFECIFEGLRAIALNTGAANSMAFDSVWDPEKYHIMMPFFYNKTQWVVSLYTTRDDIDCSIIAKRWRGGGHRKASGFNVSDIRQVFPDL